MGYQESYLKPKNKKDFDKLLNRIKENGKQFYKDNGCFPVEVLTFTKNHYPFKKNDKCIYLVGERYPQEHYDFMILRQGFFDLIEEWEDDLDPNDEQDMWKFEEYKERVKYQIGSKDEIECNIYFTEEVRPKGIWEDSGEVTDVIREKIEFD